ncbi:PRTRC genetic system ThiF family protein [Mesoflavibacter sabulilitoris]|uniref:PRTRC system ThiF family protein n=1 Tax=Mesoflavibacter zeaxanthinifaciens subsp. sabulilitoris TaxID=1520893 RepID=A0A2T1NNQ2_9FLAO|nr:PRTRC system ThiF family protein [Mesoflavibacter zeaxanthinifaciens]MBB3125269.1 PRTRC genetic system ThiF family protein [Mesoflavibacter zeaxanthinifaciens subsp. sabulilitoris]PSG94504.1 PRTRC system ThiF family protein [Mesoflavibacter zeaxanthinifaciens subsp. sabulilitoris]
MTTTYFNTPAYFINGQHRITVSLFGVGGTGSLLLTKLAKLNACLVALNHPGLFVKGFDFDTVEQANVLRQGFFMADVGKHKAKRLISKINLCYHTDWKAYDFKFEYPQQIFKDKDSCDILSSNIIISCLDTLKPRKELAVFTDLLKASNRHFNDTVKPYFWLDCGNTRTAGQCILSTIKTDGKAILPNLFERFGNIDDMETETLQGAGCSIADKLMEQDLFVNDSIALFASNLIWKLFKDKRIAHQGAFINLDTFKANPIRI